MDFSTFSDDEIDGNDQWSLIKSTTEIQGKDLLFIDSEENEVNVQNQEYEEKSNSLWWNRPYKAQKNPYRRETICM